MIKHQIHAQKLCGHHRRRATFSILGFNLGFLIFLGRRRRLQQPGGGAGGDHVLVGGVGQVDSLHAHLRRWRDDAGEALPQTEVSRCSCKRRRRWKVPFGLCIFVNICVFGVSILSVLYTTKQFFNHVWIYKKSCKKWKHLSRRRGWKLVNLLKKSV